MAPEKIDPNSTGGYSVKTDIWSLGITLVEIATARHPYMEFADYFSQIKAILYGAIPKLPSEDFSPEFCSFVEKWYGYFFLRINSFCSKFTPIYISSLIKEHEQRGNFEDLIKHEFIEKYLSESADMELVGSLIDKVQADTNES